MRATDLLVVALRVAGVVVFLHGMWGLIMGATAWLSYMEAGNPGTWLVFEMFSTAVYCGLGALLALGARKIAGWLGGGTEAKGAPSAVTPGNLRDMARYVLGLYAILLSIEPLVRVIASMLSLYEYEPRGIEWAAVVAVAAYWIFAAVLLIGPGRLGGRLGSYARSLAIEPDAPDREP